MTERSRDTAIVMRGRQHGKTAGLKRELAALERDAAISLLLEAPRECRNLGSSGRCGTCHQCRVDKFLRDVGARR